MWKAILYLGLGGVGLWLVTELAPMIVNDGCEQGWKRAGLSARYVIRTGCMVNVDGRWVLEGNLRVTVKEQPR